MDMIFKPMDESHIDRLLKIEEKCFLGDSWTRLMFESEVKNKISSFIVALSNDEEAILGYCCVWFIADFAEITNIAVSPEFWRQGIGKTILYYIIEKSKKNKCKYINLEVKSTNIAAISLYEKMGFVSVGQIKKYYKDNSDAILMTKDL